MLVHCEALRGCRHFQLQVAQDPSSGSYQYRSYLLLEYPFGRALRKPYSSRTRGEWFRGNNQGKRNCVEHRVGSRAPKVC